MRRVGNLYQKIASKENILLAINKASLGKKKRRDVKKVLDNKDEYVDKIYEMLKEEKYNPSEYMTKK